MNLVLYPRSILHDFIDTEAPGWSQETMKGGQEAQAPAPDVAQLVSVGPGDDNYIQMQTRPWCGDDNWYQSLILSLS